MVAPELTPRGLPKGMQEPGGLRSLAGAARPRAGRKERRRSAGRNGWEAAAPGGGAVRLAQPVAIWFVTANSRPSPATTFRQGRFMSQLLLPVRKDLSSTAGPDPQSGRHGTGRALLIMENLLEDPTGAPLPPPPPPPPILLVWPQCSVASANDATATTAAPFLPPPHTHRRPSARSHCGLLAPGHRRRDCRLHLPGGPAPGPSAAGPSLGGCTSLRAAPIGAC